jgi:hypothetical protein
MDHDEARRIADELYARERQTHAREWGRRVPFFIRSADSSRLERQADRPLTQFGPKLAHPRPTGRPSCSSPRGESNEHNTREYGPPCVQAQPISLSDLSR